MSRLDFAMALADLYFETGNEGAAELCSKILEQLEYELWLRTEGGYNI